MKQKLRVLIVGLSTLDVFLRGSRLPKIDDHAYLREYALLPGGSAANMAYWMAQLGVQAALCTRVGKDIAGQFVHEFLASKKVKFDALIVDPILPTGFSVIRVDRDGRIGLLHSEGANNALSPDDIRWSNLKKYDIFHVAGAMSMGHLDGPPLKRLLRQIKKLGIVTSLHTSRNTDKKNFLLECLPFLDVITTNHKEATEISGCSDLVSAAKWFHNQGINTVGITLGKAGAYVSDPTYSGTIPGFRIPVVDTTGCGDAFTAGFITGWRTDNICDRAILGNALGGLCAMTLGAMPPFDRNQLKELLMKCDKFGHSVLNNLRSLTSDRNLKSKRRSGA